METGYEIFNTGLARLLDIDGVMNVMRRDISEVNDMYLPLFYHLLNNGADSYKGNMLKYISGCSYKAKYKSDLVRYLVDNKLIDVTNRIVRGGKMFNDTRLGKHLLSIGCNKKLINNMNRL